METKEVRARRNFNFPIDPLKIKSMGEYDFILLTSRNWFEYDSARRALPGIVESWSFDSNAGFYHFKISKTARWSDGSQIKSSDLVVNLDRSIMLNSSYGKSISSIIDRTQLRINDDLNFSVKTINSLPNDSFFERMGSVFMAIVNPQDLNEDLTLRSNKFSAGPFVISSNSDEELILKPNEYFSGKEFQSPTKIVFRKVEKNFSINTFIAGKSWENYIQLYSYLPKIEAKEVLNSNLPLWTRTYDRISLLRAGNDPKKLQLRQELVKSISNALSKQSTANFPLNVKKASSLQPAGFPLHQVLNPALTKPLKKFDQNIKILAIDGLATEFHIETLNPILKELRIKATWDTKPINEFVALLTTDKSYDIALVSFGVADPEPFTWMSLVMDSEFIHVVPEEKLEFQKILQVHDRNGEITQLKSLLEKMYKRGSYSPLFWGSTLSIVQKNMSLEKIRELDETVDLSKILFKK